MHNFVTLVMRLANKIAYARMQQMIADIILSSLSISAAALLWKIIRKEKALSGKVDALKPIFRKQLVCSVCLLFWLSFFFSLFFSPLQSWIPELQMDTLWGESSIIPFLLQSMVLGFLSTLWFHVAILCIETSHYLTEKAAKQNEEY